ncbi:MAG: alpha-L-arabinofuranosidase C-terminal domain-containing protein [Parabacteroides sp.]|nr:alpha-L-arabinofuranosidase C-terminal domain-containing protein [Parabacteroides sp.]
MKRQNCVRLFLLAASAWLASVTGWAQEVRETLSFEVRADQPGASIPSTMYGIFFEDINFGADGGLYAELVKNRSFEFEQPLMGWTPFGSVEVRSDKPCFDRNPHYVRLTEVGQITHAGLENEGFRGMGIQADEPYDLTFYGRVVKGDELTLRVELVSASNDIIETQRITLAESSWKHYQLALLSKTTEPEARLRLTMETKGTLDLEHVSLFPRHTFNNRPNGLRADLAEALKALKPGVFRFPGGCIVEGTTIETRYQWKNTVGPVENRPLNINRWNYTFPHKKFPDYYQSYGLGFFEYFQLSEDLGAEPLPVLNCGLSCQFENEGMEQHVPVEKLQPYIDDALDLIEFANGPVTSRWGKLRADMGHPSPFGLKYIAIGNEQWGELYPERLAPFVQAIRARYPEIQIVGSAGPNAEGEQFEYLWPEMRRLNVDLVDEHYYRSPEWFLSNADRYDNYDRKGPKVFAGEYACHADNKANSFLTALCEAAFMTGLERNADVVPLSTYAPLFAHVEAWQWRPDLIWFDNLRVMKTPNYYVQQLYSHHAGTRVVPFLRAGKPLTGELSLYATAALDKRTNELILKVVNTGIQARQAQIQLHGLSDGTHTGTRIQFHSMDVEAVNTLEQPERVHPEESAFTYKGNQMAITIQPLSFTIYRIRL